MTDGFKSATFLPRRLLSRQPYTFDFGDHRIQLVGHGNRWVDWKDRDGTCWDFIYCNDLMSFGAELKRNHTLVAKREVWSGFLNAQSSWRYADGVHEEVICQVFKHLRWRGMTIYLQVHGRLVADFRYDWWWRPMYLRYAPTYQHLLPIFLGELVADFEGGPN